MGTAGLQARQGRRSAGGRSQPEPNTSQGLANSAGEGTDAGFLRRFSNIQQERKEQAQAAAALSAAALSAAEQAAQEKTAALYSSVRGGANATTNGQGSSTYTEGGPGQGDVDLSTSDTSLRRRGGYRRDSGLRI